MKNRLTNTLLSNFKAFLENEIGKEEMITSIRELLPQPTKEGQKSYWWKLFEGDTSANDVDSLENDLSSTVNDKYCRDCMKIAVDNPKGLQIFYS